ncbi:MAG: 2-oxoacid:acceptor oxidoreductase family protein, partial [Anaerolineae bacterium]|nr:2-oxoacid:acceptor oxidoreductase family protein [Anaerolineae bacterium]
MKDVVEIRWHGRGGQGVVTAGKLLAETALGTGQYFQAFPDYGPERMGAPIRAFTRLSSKRITIHSQIEEPDVVLVLDPTLLASVPVTDGLSEDGILLVNTS